MKLENVVEISDVSDLQLMSSNFSVINFTRIFSQTPVFKVDGKLKR